MEAAPVSRHNCISRGVPTRAARRPAIIAPSSTPTAGVLAITPMAKLP